MDLNKKPESIELVLASPRGFCAGVDRAITIVEKALQMYGSPIYVQHEIVHNKHVVQRLRESGAIFVENIDEIPLGSHAIYSAHGVSPAVRKIAERRKLKVLDATCPLVTKVHGEAQRYAQKDFTIILIGHHKHVEVQGTVGEAPERIIVVGNLEEVDSLVVPDENKVGYITQTTLSVDDTEEIINTLKNKFPDINEPRKEDICYATTNRQAAVKKIAKQCDAFFVIGSRNSSNSLRLVEVAKNNGCKYAELIHSQSNYPIEKISNCKTIGISSGASAPEILVKEFIDDIKKKFTVEIEEVEIVKENITFKIPGKLN